MPAIPDRLLTRPDGGPASRSASVPAGLHSRNKGGGGGGGGWGGWGGLVFQGFLVASVVPFCTGCLNRRWAAVRPAWSAPRFPLGDGRVGPGLLGDTTTGSTLGAPAMCPQAPRIRAGDARGAQHDQRKETKIWRGAIAQNCHRSRDAERHPTMLMKDTKKPTSNAHNPQRMPIVFLARSGHTNSAFCNTGAPRPTHCRDSFW